MLKPGRYVAENNDDHLFRYKIVMDVKETEKSYVFTMVEYDNRYGYDHIATMFKGKTRKTIRKDKPSGHAMRDMQEGIDTAEYIGEHFIRPMMDGTWEWEVR